MPSKMILFNKIRVNVNPICLRNVYHIIAMPTE